MIKPTYTLVRLNVKNRTSVEKKQKKTYSIIPLVQSLNAGDTKQDVSNAHVLF